TSLPLESLTVVKTRILLAEEFAPGTVTAGSTLVANDAADDTEAIESEMMLKSANLDKFILSLQNIY
ncbi:MAG: hypothetical protein HOD57_02520, partial [Rhodobacterales bacterium]|nr:hypothetical protein [Rhodobacterales bacterium]